MSEFNQAEINDTEEVTSHSDRGNYDIETNALSSSSYSIVTQRTYVSDFITLEALKDYIKNPMIFNQILRKISREMYSYNGQYAGGIEKAVSLPTLAYLSLGRKKTESSVSNKNKIDLIMKKISHRVTTRDILRHLFIDGMYVGILRDTKPTNKNITPQQGDIDGREYLEGLSLEKNMMIQPLDLDYCKIVGFSKNVNVAAFNMQYFDQFKQGGLIHEIKNFPPEFVKAYNDYRKDPSKQWFVLDTKKTVALKSKANLIEPYGRPYGLQAFKDMRFSEDYEDSQNKLVEELASSVYYLVLPQGREVGTSMLNKDQQTRQRQAFENAVKIGADARGAKISTLTLAPNSQIGRLEKDTNLLQDKLSEIIMRKISTNTGFASSMLNGESGSGSNYASLQFNVDMLLSEVFVMLQGIANEYTRILNEYIGVSENSYIDINYLPISIVNQDDTYQRAKELYTLAGGSRSYMIAAAGFDPDQYLRMCDYEIDQGYEEKYHPHATAYTSSGNDKDENGDSKESGRPEGKLNDLSPEGMQTRTNGGNKSRKK